MNEILVRFLADVPETQRRALVESLGYRVVEEIAAQHILVIRSPMGVTLHKALTQWRTRPEIHHAEPNTTVFPHAPSGERED